ncbi:transglycosylase domain-containing protein [Candidatus Saccharibacteria bacterium]|nr:transglycosylase domain-containing protein [Candidatus Saccharibacteria bacterium]
MALKKSSNINHPRKSSNVHVTKSGKKIKLNTSLTDKVKARRDEKALRKAERLSKLPKGRFKRILYRLHPKQLKEYWFSREGRLMALKIVGIGIVSVFVLMIGVFAYFRKDLPNLRDISGSNIGGSIRYFDKTGETLLWEDYDAVKRIPVKSEDIAEYLKQATIALEDRDFFKHGGFDMKGISRAAWANVTGGSTSQGGSTITQQLVKLSQDWSADRSYTRKVKELILAIELERSYTKDEIITGYLNAAPYGNIQYGAEVAAQDYFHKSAKDLTLAESVFLASIPQSPSFYSPYGAYFNEENSRGETGNEALVGRMHYTLNIMHEMGYITEDEKEEAKAVDVLATVHKTESKYHNIKAPHFVLAAKEELEKKYSAETVNRSGWKVTTTLDLNLQTIAEEEVASGIKQVEKQGGNVAAFTAEDVETGQIVAMVGGPDFTNTEFGENNYARTPLPPGSSFKPYDYTALIESTENTGAGSVLYDTQGVLPGYPCTNKSIPKNGGNCLYDYDLRYPGPITIRYALGGSRNVPAVKAMLIAGVEKTIDTAESLMNASNPNSYGYNCYAPDTVEFVTANEAACYGSSSIGDGAYLKMDEHVHGLATLSRNGLNIPRTYILSIKDATDKTTYEWKLEGGTQVVREDTAYIINDILSDPNASYLATKPHTMPGNGGAWKVAVKTGTTNDSKDGWMTGYTSKYAAAVWVGYYNRTKEMSGYMETMTRPIFQNWMKRAHQDLAPKDWEKPAGIQTLSAYIVRNSISSGSRVPSPDKDLFPSWYSKTNSSNQKRTIDIISGKLATECTPALAKKEETGGTATQYSSDTFVDGTSSSTTNEQDDLHKCSDARPSVTVNRSLGLANSYTLSATVLPGTHALNGNEDKGAGKVEFIVNGEVVGSHTLTGQGLYSINYTPTTSGNLSFTARVIDSAMYDATSNSLTISVIALKYNGNGKFSWTGASGSVSVYPASGGTPICSNSSCSVANPSFTGGSVYARDNSNASPVISASD